MPEPSAVSRQRDIDGSHAAMYFGTVAAASFIGVLVSIVVGSFGLLVGSGATGILSLCIFELELLPVHPQPLSVVCQPVIGRWRASLPLEYLPSVKRSHSRTETTLFQGWIEFFKDGSVLWEADGRYANLYGDLKKVWRPPYETFARHVKGHVIHVVIRTCGEEDGETTDIYLRGRRRFPV